MPLSSQPQQAMLAFTRFHKWLMVVALLQSSCSPKADWNSNISLRAKHYASETVLQFRNAKPFVVEFRANGDSVEIHACKKLMYYVAEARIKTVNGSSTIGKLSVSRRNKLIYYEIYRANYAKMANDHWYRLVTEKDKKLNIEHPVDSLLMRMSPVSK